MKKLLLPALAVIAAPVMAHAADLSYKSDSPTALLSPAPWTGFHAGAGGGLFWGTAAASASTDIAFFECEGSCQAYSQSNSQDLTKQGWFGTVEAGYDRQLGSIVLGAAASFDFKDKSTASVTFNGQDNQTPPNTSSQRVDVEFGDSFAVYGRLGVLVTERTLVYGLGGYANQQVKLSSSLEAGNAGSLGVVDGFSTATSYQSSAYKDGWMVGAGLEQLLWSGFSLKAEYRYADFGKISASESYNGPNCTFCTYTVASKASADLSTQSVRVLLSYRF
jgi:outer membrane immunogenic protein